MSRPAAAPLVVARAHHRAARPDRIVQAHHVLVTYLVPDATLVVVAGGPADPGVLRAVTDEIAELNLAARVERADAAGAADWEAAADVVVDAGAIDLALGLPDGAGPELVAEAIAARLAGRADAR